jgi:hypothetical protein
MHSPTIKVVFCDLTSRKECSIPSRATAFGKIVEVQINMIEHICPSKVFALLCILYNSDPLVHVEVYVYTHEMFYLVSSSLP